MIMPIFNYTHASEVNVSINVRPAITKTINDLYIPSEELVVMESKDMIDTIQPMVEGIEATNNCQDNSNKSFFQSLCNRFILFFVNIF